MIDGQPAKHRFFVGELQPGRVSLPRGQVHHAVHVLRLGVGAVVELLDGRGAVATGEIVELRKNLAVVEVRDIETIAISPGPSVHLGFAVPKGKRLDWLLEKAAELGAASLRPVVFERSISGGGKPTEERRRRWESHCIAAAKQSGINFLPEIHDPIGLAELVLIPPGPNAELRLFGDPREHSDPLTKILSSARGYPQAEIHILIGPEGGLSDTERGLLTGAGYLPVRIGHTTLRIETAAVALLAAVIALHHSPNLPD